MTVVNISKNFFENVKYHRNIIYNKLMEDIQEIVKTTPF